MPDKKAEEFLARAWGLIADAWDESDALTPEWKADAREWRDEWQEWLHGSAPVKMGVVSGLCDVPCLVEATE